MKVSLLFFALITLVNSCLDPSRPPESSLGFFNEIQMSRAGNYSMSRGGIAFAIRIARTNMYEDYDGTYILGSTRPIYAAGHGYLAVLVAKCVELELLDWDDEIGAYIPEWENDVRGTITIRHLLSMSSGLPTNEETPPRKSVWLNYSLVHTPGTTFTYGHTDPAVLAEVVRNATNENPVSFLNDRILNVLQGQITGMQYLGPNQTEPNFSTGISTNTARWLGFGEMLAAYGQFRALRLLDSTSVAELMKPSAVAPAYGLGFWLNNPVDVSEPFLNSKPSTISNPVNGFLFNENAPPSMMVAAGANHQRLYIFPGMRLVLLRFGDENNDFSDKRLLDYLF